MKISGKVIATITYQDRVYKSSTDDQEVRIKIDAYGGIQVLIRPGGDKWVPIKTNECEIEIDNV